jgi:hypothetical protein
MTEEIDFHPDAHPEATEITGDSNFGEWGQCIATNRNDERCGGHAKGPHGKCHDHGGASTGAPEGNDNAVGNSGGAPEGNLNATRHAMYADSNATYREIFTDLERELADGIFIDYYEEYCERHGSPPLGHEVKLFGIAVNMVKEIHGENWAVEKPDSLESDNPLVDKETRIKTGAQGGTFKETRYKKTVVLAAQKTLSNDTRQWLKDLGLMQSPEDRQADAEADLAAAWREAVGGE